jgi:hypothetical protein
VPLTLDRMEYQMQSISDGTLNALVIAALIVFAMVQLARMIERHSPMNRDDY